ncbi:sugar isomerase domain-containing protein [Microbacterium lacticum]|uniref:sugar isomerase domain-containing protein n=1 Tax=Microbacterium lacticum TaxID=33885 RepID=UPI001F582219|nr:sugar isomerase domain-containing protein [Microbacterium lacticum]
MHDLARYVDDVLTANEEGIAGCADVVVATGRAGGLVRPAGAGHSLAAVLETFFRAGGLAFVRPLWSEDVLPLRGARASTTGERIPGRGRAVAEAAAITADDTVVVFSNSGINPYPVEIAEVARDAGATVVAFTSRTATAAATPRARHRLVDLADIVLDTLVPPGDVTWPADAPVTSPVSSLATTALWTAVLRDVHDRWPDAPRWRSANVPGTDADNAAVMDAFTSRIPEL